MKTETIQDPRDSTQQIPLDPWMIRWVMWIREKGSMHVAIGAAVIGDGIVTRLACGRGGQTLQLTTSTWFYIRGHNPRICRGCIRALKAAGKSGRIDPGASRA